MVVVSNWFIMYDTLLQNATNVYITTKCVSFFITAW